MSIDTINIATLSRNFETACRSILSQLSDTSSLECWFITYPKNGQWLNLFVEGDHYVLPENQPINWAKESCNETVMENDSSNLKNEHLSPGPSLALGASQLNQQPVSAHIGIPIYTGNRQIFGWMYGVTSREHVTATDLPISILSLFAQVMTHLLAAEIELHEQRRKTNQLFYLSNTDALTGLMNRRSWSHVIDTEESRLKRYGKKSSVFIIDLDKLKQVNDLEGHYNGDLLIKKTATCLRRACRESDLIARLGGDEFGILAIECSEVGAEKLLQTIRVALVEDGINASIGYCVLQKNLGMSEALDIADKNMYKEKNAKHKNNIQRYSNVSTSLYSL